MEGQLEGQTGYQGRWAAPALLLGNCHVVGGGGGVQVRKRLGKALGRRQNGWNDGSGYGGFYLLT